MAKTKQEISELDRDLELLEAELKRLEAEYNMFFAGRLPRPPWETRGRVSAMVRRLDNIHIPNTGGRFRFNTIQSRFQTFSELWDRGLRAREEGRRVTTETCTHYLVLDEDDLRRQGGRAKINPPLRPRAAAG